MVKRKKPGPRATQDPRVVRLLALQDKLGLTDFQRRFVEALAVGGDLDGGAVAQSLAEMQILHEGSSSPNLKDAQELLQERGQGLLPGLRLPPN